MENIFDVLIEHLKYNYASDKENSLIDTINQTLNGLAVLKYKYIKLNEDVVLEQLNNRLDKEIFDAHFSDNEMTEFEFNLRYNIFDEEFVDNDIEKLSLILDRTIPIKSIKNDILASAERIENVLNTTIAPILEKCENELKQYMDIQQDIITLPDVHSDEFKALIRKYLSDSFERIIGFTIKETLPVERGVVYSGYKNGVYSLANQVGEQANVFYININEHTVEYKHFNGFICDNVSNKVTFSDILNHNQTVNGYDLSDTIKTFNQINNYFNNVKKTA